MKAKCGAEEDLRENVDELRNAFQKALNIQDQIFISFRSNANDTKINYSFRGNARQADRLQDPSLRYDFEMNLPKELRKYF